MTFLIYSMPTATIKTSAHLPFQLLLLQFVNKYTMHTPSHTIVSGRPATESLGQRMVGSTPTNGWENLTAPTPQHTL